jgi:hypothetical protein
MSKHSPAVLAAALALSIASESILASAERGEVITIVTDQGQKLVFDPHASHTPAATEGASPGPAVVTEEGAGSALAPTEVVPNTSAAAGQVEVDVSAPAGEASALPADSAASAEAHIVEDAAKHAPAGAKAGKKAAK